jgi:hypothetical protein
VTDPKTAKAREYVAADLDDAIQALDDADALLGETGLEDEALDDALHRARTAAAKARDAFAEAAR